MLATLCYRALQHYCLLNMQKHCSSFSVLYCLRSSYCPTYNPSQIYSVLWGHFMDCYTKENVSSQISKCVDNSCKLRFSPYCWNEHQRPTVVCRCWQRPHMWKYRRFQIRQKWSWLLYASLCYFYSSYCFNKVYI